MFGLGVQEILLVLVILIVEYLLLSRISNRYRTNGRITSNAGGDARSVLDRRYARGEISREEYGRMRRDIGS